MPALLGCSPEHDWREVRAPSQGYTVMLPGKSTEATRAIDLGGVKASMSMRGLQVGETWFTVGVAELPDAMPATHVRALGAMRAGMLRNIGAAEAPPQPLTVRVIDGQGQRVASADGQRIDAPGRLAGTPVAMNAGFVASGARAYQWVVLGPPGHDAERATFVESFKLLQAGAK